MTATASWPALAATLSRWFPEPRLAAAGLVALALVPLGALWAAVDGRCVAGEVVALKPTRFTLSIGVYLLTACWMLGYAQNERLSAPLVRGAEWGLVAGAGIELICIILQAARGRRSHLNLSTPFDAAISVTMSVMALLFSGMVLPIAWEIARRPRPQAPPPIVGAVVAGLVATFVLGALTGAGMAQVAAGAITPEPVRLPLLGTIRGGSLRIAHFLGVHAMQGLPLIAAIALTLRGRAATALLAVGASCYVALTLFLWSHTILRASGQASVGRSLPAAG